MDDKPLHWSERARLANPSGLPPISELHQPPPAPRSRKKFLLGGVGIICVAAIAVAVVVFTTSGDGTVGVSTISSVNAPSTSLSSPSTASAAGSIGPTSSTTTTIDAAALVSYEDAERGFGVKYPAAWKNTSESRLGDGETDPYFVVGFADQTRAAQDGQLLNFVAVEVFADTPMYEAMLPALQEAMRQGLEEARNTYEDVEVIEPIRSLWVGGAPGFTLTYSFSWQGERVIVSDYALIANKRGYGLEVSACADDFEACAPLFDTIIQDFKLGPSQQKM